MRVERRSKVRDEPAKALELRQARLTGDVKAPAGPSRAIRRKPQKLWQDELADCRAEVRASPHEGFLARAERPRRRATDLAASESHSAVGDPEA